MDYGENLHKCREYITALEDEKRKIEMFQRELPLCLELVSQAIENYEQQLVGITTTATTTFSPATVAGPTTTTDQCLNGQSECSEQTTSDCPPPVLEEFMPIRRPTSNSTDEEEEASYNHHPDELESRHNNNSKRLDNDLQTGTSIKKVDWLRSVQLWNPTVPDPPHMEHVEDIVIQENRNLNYQHPRKVQVVEVKTSGSGGAFHPFQKVQNSSGSSVQHQSNHVVKPAVIIPTTTASITPAISVGTPSTTTKPPNAQANIASSSGERTATAVVCGSTVAASNKKEEGSSSKDGSGGSSASRKARRCWSPELHKKFLNALQQLGGSHATPKQIRELMKVDGLTNDEVKSHLQKYRLHTRRISPTIHHHHNNSNTQQPPQFVVVGGIWVPSPTEYAAAVAQPEDPISSFHPHTAVSTAGSAPPLSVSTSHHHPNQNQSTTLTTVRNSMRSEEEEEEEEEERGSRSRLSSGHSNGRCNSPATSSSTHTTTTSPAAAQAH